MPTLYFLVRHLQCRTRFDLNVSTFLSITGLDCRTLGFG